MSRAINLNLANLKRQLDNSKNVNVLKKPRKIVRVKRVNKPAKPVSRVKKLTKPINHQPPDHTFWNLLYVLLSLVVLFLIVMLLYNLYTSFQIGASQAISDQQTAITIEDRVKKAPKGVIIDKEGAPISIEKGGNMADNKYLALYGGDDFMRKSQYSPSGIYSPYAPYPGGYSGGYSGGYGSFSSYGAGYYSQSDDGITKIYYENNMNPNRSNLNEYIKNQNKYIRNINKRVRQINTGRMYTPTYSRDKAALREIRGYERRLANQVHRETKNQPYLSDRSNYY